MKIVYCMWGIFVTGGKERVLINKANYLVKHGYEVCIVTTEQQRRKPAYPMDRKIQHYDLGINYSLKPHSSYVAKIWSYVTKTYKHQKKDGTVVENFKC